MTTTRQHIRHVFSGGFASDFGPTTEAPVDEFGRINIPFMIKAENVFFELNGGPHKIGGTAKLNATTIEGGANINGLFDYWKMGTGGSPTQKRIVHAGTKILKDDADGTFDDLFTGMSANAIPSYALFDDILIIGSDSSDVPRSWDQSTAQNLAGSPPNFAFSEPHRGRLWAAGVSATPSTIYYSSFDDPEDWTASDSGSFTVSPDDGDVITAIASHKDELWVFKGPYKGSIHRVTGSAPTGGDSFSLHPFVKGLGAVYQNTIFRFRDDLGFMWSDGSIHSLAATASFGDFKDAALSSGIDTYLKNNVVFNRLKQAWAATDSQRGQVIFTLPIAGSTTNNVMLMMDFRFQPVRWAVWTHFASTALATVIDQTASDVPVIMSGATDGFVRTHNKALRSIDEVTSISASVKTPFLHYGLPIMKKTITDATVGVQPKGAATVLFGWQRDDQSQQTTTINQGGGASLAPATQNQFTLGTSTLSGGDFIDRFIDLDTGGEFRSIQFEVANSNLNEDLEVHSFSIVVEGGAWSTEN